MQEDITDKKRAEQEIREANIRLAEANTKLEQRVANRTEQLAEAKNRLEKIFNCSPVGVAILCWEDRRFLNVNQAFADIFGFTREEILGRNPADLRILENDPQPLRLREVLGREGHARNFQSKGLKKSGEAIELEISAELIEMDGTRCALINVMDVTERLKIDRELREALRAAAAANRAKSEFLANMSHEIRTPMNAIMGYAQMLQRDAALPDAIRSQIEIISRNSQALLSLLNSILELSKLEVGRALVRADVFSPMDLFDDLVSLFRERAMTKHIALALFKTADLPPFIEADQSKIRQIVANLLSNAIKFTRHGGVQLSVSAAGPAAPYWKLVVEVKDTGPGIPAEELPQLFQKFGQTSSGRGSTLGTGLGLYLSRQYAVLLGGDLTVQSQPDVGSVFRLEVPVKAAAPYAAAVGRADLPTLRRVPGAPGYRIVVADDLADNRDVLRLLLERVGFEVQNAVNGWEALRLWKAWQPHLILMDAWMPEMDGYEATRRLRDSVPGREPRVLMISASAFEEDRLAALAVGADDFIAKPFRDLELLEQIRAQLGCEYETGPAPAAIAQPATAPALNPEAASRLPLALRQDLRAAILIGDFDRVASLLAEVKRLDSELAMGLTALANQFNATELLRLLVA
jgi:two-component system sensor histidine kinase/response regulator